MTTFEWISMLLAPVTGVASWLAATRLRQNVYAELTEARKEIVGLSAQVAQLTLENAELKQLIENL